MNIIYIDRLSMSSLLAVVFSGAGYSHVFYFNKAAISDTVINFFIKTGLLKVRPQPAEFSLADIRDEKGECQFVKIVEDVKDICLQISDKEFAGNCFLKGFGKYFDFKKILLFFEKTVSSFINDSVIFLHAAQWHAIHRQNKTPEAALFFMEKNLWSKYLAGYASKSLGIKTVEYRSMAKVYNQEYFIRGKSLIASLIKSKTKLATHNIRTFEKTDRIAYPPCKTAPLLAAWYSGKTVTFDFKKRSEFFWLLKSDVPRKQVLIYFDRTDVPATLETADILQKEGVNLTALTGGARSSDKIPIWRAGPEYGRSLRNFFKIILSCILSSLIKFRKISFFFVSNMIVFAYQYSFWYDFFKSNSIKININPVDYSRANICMHLALEKNDGVSISYQWSNLTFPSIILSSGADVLFSFGPAYRWIWEATRSSIANLVYSGYMTDYSFKEVREDSLKLRGELKARGVKFIICYFDENSADDRMSPIPNKRSAEIYKYFIERMLEDKTLGLIFKPGYPKTLYQRVSSIADLIDKARASGRCIFLDKGSYVSEKYPSEAAQASDLCVGLLLSGTVALESYLSGTPTVFIDMEGLYSNPVYQWGSGKVVFDSLDDLFSEIKKFRDNPERIPGCGDLSSWVKDRDRFRDGNASLRIGQYINWLTEIFNQGKTREEAMTYANQKYGKLWGSENIVKIIPNPE